MRVFNLTFVYKNTNAIHIETYSSFKEAYERLEEYVTMSYGRTAKIVETITGGSTFESEVYYEILGGTGKKIDIYKAIQISSNCVIGLPNQVTNEQYNRTYQEYREVQQKELPYCPKGEVL